MNVIIKKTLTFELLQDNTTWNIVYNSGNITIKIQTDTAYLNQAIGKDISNITLNDIMPLKAYIEADKAGVAIVSTVTTNTNRKEVFKNFERNITITVEEDVFCTLVTDDGRKIEDSVMNIARLTMGRELELISMQDFEGIVSYKEKSQAID